MTVQETINILEDVTSEPWNRIEKEKKTLQPFSRYSVLRRTKTIERRSNRVVFCIDLDMLRNTRKGVVI